MPTFADIDLSPLLPFIADRALEYRALFGDARIEIVHAGSAGGARSVTWTQRQCLCILCNSLLCAWPGRTSANCVCAEARDLPSINFDEMLSAGLKLSAAGAGVAKVEMFLHYAARQRERIARGDALARPLTFTRAAAPGGQVVAMGACAAVRAASEARVPRASALCMTALASSSLESSSARCMTRSYTSDRSGVRRGAGQ